MDIGEIRNYCLSLKGATENIKWENHLCFCVGEKMFLVTNPDGYPITASFKTNDTLFDQLIQRDGFIPAPYMARNKWVHIDDINRLGAKEWKDLIDIAYALIFNKLTQKLKKELLADKENR